jgi:hypothetical protein
MAEVGGFRAVIEALVANLKISLRVASLRDFTNLQV